jgi:hypothetical protein
MEQRRRAPPVLAGSEGRTPKAKKNWPGRGRRPGQRTDMNAIKVDWGGTLIVHTHCIVYAEFVPQLIL